MIDRDPALALAAVLLRYAETQVRALDALTLAASDRAVLDQVLAGLHDALGAIEEGRVEALGEAEHALYGVLETLARRNADPPSSP